MQDVSARLPPFLRDEALGTVWLAQPLLSSRVWPDPLRGAMSWYLASLRSLSGIPARQKCGCAVYSSTA